MRAPAGAASVPERCSGLGARMPITSVRTPTTASSDCTSRRLRKQRSAAKRNVKKAQAGAKKKQTLKNLPSKTRTALGKEAAAVRRGDEPTRKELEQQARRLNIKGRSKMGKAELKRAVARAK